jgi:DNA repair exonuclease SbcCD ATPase subunit
MIEVDLEELEDFLRERINTTYFKMKRACKKLISDMRTSLIEIKVCMDHFIESGTDKVKEKALRSLNFFSDRIKKEIDEVEIPEDEEIYYDNILKLLSSIKKLFTSMNEIQRKSLPRFHKEVQAEIKELAYLQRKLAKKQSVLDVFLRKKYTNPKDNVKTAEDLLKRIPKLFTLKENIENSKADLEGFEEELEKRKEEQNNQNRELIDLEKDEAFKELENVKDSLFKLRLKINDQLGFKKALKKLKFELEKENIHLTNININFLRDFLKNPIKLLTSERKDLPNFTSLLVQLRHALEGNKLNLKSDTRDKTISQINAIFDQKELQTNIEKYNEIKNDVKSVENKIKEAGLSKKLEDLKNKIAMNAVKIEHVENDLNRKNKDYLRHLGNLKREREALQKDIRDILGIDVKIKITFNF